MNRPSRHSRLEELRQKIRAWPAFRSFYIGDPEELRKEGLRIFKALSKLRERANRSAK